LSAVTSSGCGYHNRSDVPLVQAGYALAVRPCRAELIGLAVGHRELVREIEHFRKEMQHTRLELDRLRQLDHGACVCERPAGVVLN
jgi:hypothetical protein